MYCKKAGFRHSGTPLYLYFTAQIFPTVHEKPKPYIEQAFMISDVIHKDLAFRQETLDKFIL